MTQWLWIAPALYLYIMGIPLMAFFVADEKIRQSIWKRVVISLLWPIALPAMFGILYSLIASFYVENYRIRAKIKKPAH